MTASINAMVQSGVVTCVSAGNNDNCPTTPGGNPAGIGDIAVAAEAITVAAASDQSTEDRIDDVIAGFSRIGPGLGPDPKPNITAYGATCTPACPTGCASGLSHLVTCANNSGGYSGFSGTSCASPQVAGACALLLEVNPVMTPAAIKQILTSNAEDFGAPGRDNAWGHGLLDLRQIFGNPMSGCDLQVQNMAVSPSPIDCNQPVTVTATIRNVGVSSVTNFTVNLEYWYFTAGGPAVRFDLIPVPMQNTSGPLLPGGMIDFVATVDLQLITTPLSQHMCFWGVVDASCDNIISNNEKHVNATILNLQGTQCEPFSPPSAGSGIASDTMCVPVRLAHEQEVVVPVTVVADNPDPVHWNIFLEHQGLIGNQLTLDVDPSGCPVSVNVCAEPLLPEIDDSVDVFVYSYNEFYGNFGDALITFLARGPEETCCDVPGDANGNGSVNIADVTFLIARIFAGGLAPGCCPEGDANGNGAINIADVTFLISRIFAGGPAPNCGPPDMLCTSH